MLSGFLMAFIVIMGLYFLKIIDIINLGRRNTNVEMYLVKDRS
jgi:hypothetical protein